MAIPRNLANLANQLNTDGEVPKIEVGDTSVAVTDTGSNGKITGTADNTAVFSVEKGKTFVLQGGVSSTGVGIAFPADQTTVGASSDANTLDDYEEGSWTPALSIETSGSVTYSSQSGSYTRVGNAVIATGYITLSATSSPTGALGLTGLPFSAVSASYNAVNFGWVRNLGSAGIILRGYTNASATTCTLSKNATNAGNTDLAGSDLTSTTSLAFSISYLI